MNNQTPECGIQHTVCGSQSRVNWEDCSRKGILHKIWECDDRFCHCRLCGYCKPATVIWWKVKAGKFHQTVRGHKKSRNGKWLFSGTGSIGLSRWRAVKPLLFLQEQDIGVWCILSIPRLPLNPWFQTQVFCSYYFHRV